MSSILPQILPVLFFIIAGGIFFVVMSLQKGKRTNLVAALLEHTNGKRLPPQAGRSNRVEAQFHGITVVMEQRQATKANNPLLGVGSYNTQVQQWYSARVRLPSDLYFYSLRVDPQPMVGTAPVVEEDYRAAYQHNFKVETNQGQWLDRVLDSSLVALHLARKELSILCVDCVLEVNSKDLNCDINDLVAMMDLAGAYASRMVQAHLP